MKIGVDIPGSGKSVLSLDGKDAWAVGRADDCDIVVAEKCVSRRHASFRKIGAAWFVTDLGSHGGTFVNEQRIDSLQALNPGDVVKIGHAVFTPGIAVSEEGPKAVADQPIPQLQPSPSPSVTSSKPEVKYKEPPVDENGKRRLPLYTPEGCSVDVNAPEVRDFMTRMQERILEKMNLDEDKSKAALTQKEMAAKCEVILDETLREMRHLIPAGVDEQDVRQLLLDELIGFGPLSPLVRDKTISEIMINGPQNVFVEQKGLLKRATITFKDEAQLQVVIQRIVEPLGRHCDAASPMVDARLPDGSRVNAIIPPLALDGSDVTIRKFADKKLTSDDLVKFGSLTPGMAAFLKEAVRVRKNIVVSGGTGSGKTTLLNILSQFIPYGERVITVEDSAELKLDHENLCRLEARPANVEGKGRVTIRDLVINTLRMRPDRIVVGECRGAEALDMLQAMNTGHDGSLTTLHANTPRDALGRLENMVMMAGFDLPSSAIREQIAAAIDLIVQQTRLPDGSRKVVKISEVTGREGDMVLLQDVFTFEQDGFDENFKVVGKHNPTGNIPLFIEELRKAGDLQLDMGVFVPEG